MQKVPPPKEPRPKAPEKPIQQAPPFLNKPREALVGSIRRLWEEIYTRHQIPKKTFDEIIKELTSPHVVGQYVVGPNGVANLNKIFRNIVEGVSCDDPKLKATAEKIKKIIGGEIKPKEVAKFLKEKLGL
jgi:hypothetical protein